MKTTPENHSKERPILFNGDMVRAILRGRKTQTRRVIKGIPDNAHLITYYGEDAAREVLKNSLGWFVPEAFDLWPCNDDDRLKCPHGKVGDVLYVRETFREIYDYCEHPEMAGCPDEYWTLGYQYRADMNCIGLGEYTDSLDERDGFHTEWKPSIHMPKTASRIKLKITDIRVEQAQSISSDDIKSEGIQQRFPNVNDQFTPKILFGQWMELWQSVYGSESWSENPWVWVIEFERI